MISLRALDVNNNKTSYTLKENGEQKTQNTYSYNALNQLTNQTIDDTILTYQYNPVGNLISDAVGAYTSTYEYNDGNMFVLKNK